MAHGCIIVYKILGDNTMMCVGLYAEKLDVPIVGIAPVAFYDPLLSVVCTGIRYFVSQECLTCCLKEIRYSCSCRHGSYDGYTTWKRDVTYRKNV